MLCYATLNSLEGDMYLNGPTIVSDILVSFPRDILRSWKNYAALTLKKSPCEVVLEDLIKWFDQYTKGIIWTYEDQRKIISTNKI
jgi:hypothetical protein